MSADRQRPRPIPRAKNQASQPYVFTLERREGTSGAYSPWAIAVIELGATSVALRLKAADGGAHTEVDAFPLELGGAARFFKEDLPQLGRANAEVTRNTPSIFFVLGEIAKRFNMRGIAVFRGRATSPLLHASSPDERIQSAADAEFAARCADMVATGDDAIRR
jgi:hypothetical protein